MEMLQCHCSAMRNATRAITHAYDRALRPSGLRMTQFSVLVRVAAMGEQTVGDLANMMAMDQTALGRSLRPLERDDMVRVTVGADRRERRVSITANGQEALARASSLWKSVHQRFEAKVGAEESLELREAMKRLVNIGRALVIEDAVCSNLSDGS